MFIIRGFRGIKKFEKLCCSKYINVRLISTENIALSKDNEVVKRKYVKPEESTKESAFMKDDFVKSLFSGLIDKRIFEYPAVLRAADIDIVISHSAEVESFLRNASKNELSEETIKKLRELELFGLSVPQKYGGAGYNETEFKYLQECTGSNPTIGRFLAYNENFGCKLLNLYGTEEQKEKYLPRITQGKSFISLAYLEKGPLIDLSKLEGQAVNDEINNQFILKAEKKWVHFADKADLFLVVVKSSSFFDSDLEVEVKFNFFIVESDTPGVTVHKLKSEYAQENNLYDVSFNDVVIPSKNVLGNLDFDGYQILRSAISYNNVTDATFCCNKLKHILHDVIEFINEKTVTDKSTIDHSLVQENLVSIIMFIYALESVVYLITGRYDTHHNPDLFNESIIAKALAVDFLQMAIKKYIEILGREAFKSSGILEEAMEVLQYYSVFEENIEYLKMMGTVEGIILAGNKLMNKVMILRRPHENNWEAIKLNFTRARKLKVNNLNIKEELQETLKYAADSLEESFAIFQAALEEMFVRKGSSVMNSDHIIVKFGDMATYIYACIACLSRASSSLCYDFNDCNNEAILAQVFSYFTNAKIKELYEEEMKHEHLTEYYIKLGKEIYSRKQYPVEHPLSRTF